MPDWWQRRRRQQHQGAGARHGAGRHCGCCARSSPPKIHNHLALQIERTAQHAGRAARVWRSAQVAAASCRTCPPPLPDLSCILRRRRRHLASSAPRGGRRRHSPSARPHPDGTPLLSGSAAACASQRQRAGTVDVAGRHCSCRAPIILKSTNRARRARSRSCILPTPHAGHHRAGGASHACGGQGIALGRWRTGDVWRDMHKLPAAAPPYTASTVLATWSFRA